MEQSMECQYLALYWSQTVWYWLDKPTAVDARIEMIALGIVESLSNNLAPHLEKQSSDRYAVLATKVNGPNA